MSILLHAPALLIAIPLLAAFASVFLNRIGKKALSAWVVFALLATEAIAVLLLLDVMSGARHVYSLGASVPGIVSSTGFPVRIVLVGDALSAMVVFVAITIALLAGIFSTKFIEEGKEKFYSLFLLLTAGMAGLSLTGDFFTMFVFLEMLSISSAGLIAFFREGTSFEAAFKYMVVSSIGILFLLFGVGLLYGKYGFLNIAAVASMAAMQFSFIDGVALALISAALLLKSGAVPAHLWKPDVYQKAPAPVVAVLLTSGLVGVYLLFRILFMIVPGAGISQAVGSLIAGIGLVSIFVGVTMALKQESLRRLMGYAAVAETGYILLAIGTALSVASFASVFSMNALMGGIFHIINDAIDLGFLFLAIGAVSYVAKTDNLSEIKGLAHKAPGLSVIFLIGLLAISGMPPLNGFASKLMIFESLYFFSPLLSIVALLGSMAMLAIFVKVFASIFLGPAFKGTVRKLPRRMAFVLLCFVLTMILIGFFPGLVVDLLVEPAAAALTSSCSYIGGIL